MTTYPTLTDGDPEPRKACTDTREELIRKGYTPEGADETLALYARFEELRARARARDAREADDER